MPGEDNRRPIQITYGCWGLRGLQVVKNKQKQEKVKNIMRREIAGEKLDMTGG